MVCATNTVLIRRVRRGAPMSPSVSAGGYPLGEAVGAHQQLADGEAQSVAARFLLDLALAA